MSVETSALDIRYIDEVYGDERIKQYSREYVVQQISVDLLRQ